jgi:cystathionine beta-lyase family protein involved in aluminum resistance
LISEIEKLVKLTRSVSPNTFIVVDNCYGEFVEKLEPTDVGADVAIGSLIKNPGGGLASTGAYMVGTKKAIDLISTRLTSPSLKTEVGSYERGYREFFQGLFLAPHVVLQAIKGAYLLGEVMAQKGYDIMPKSNEIAYDIVKSIKFNTADELIKFVQEIQKQSPVDSFVLPLPWGMPGYTDQVIMAAGTFVSGASIELSCDSPIRAPYIAYFQGGLTYEHIKLIAIEFLDKF